MDYQKSSTRISKAIEAITIAGEEHGRKNNDAMIVYLLIKIRVILKEPELEKFLDKLMEYCTSRNLSSELLRLMKIVNNIRKLGMEKIKRLIKIMERKELLDASTCNMFKW